MAAPVIRAHDCFRIDPCYRVLEEEKKPNGLDPYAGTFEQERFNSTNSNWRLSVAWDGLVLHGNGKIRCAWM